MPNCCPPENRRRAFLACLPGLALCAGPTAAAPTRVEPFDAESWAEWPRQVTARNQPLMVVFSATWCAVCPQLIDRLAADPRRRRRGVPLWVVMTDLAPGENDARLLASPHYHVADRLLAFDGPAAAIRHAVDPRWRGLSPSVAWLAPGRPTEFVQGAPAAAQLAAWLGGR